MKLHEFAWIHVNSCDIHMNSCEIHMDSHTFIWIRAKFMNLQADSIFGSLKCPFACLWGALWALGVIRGILLVTLWLHWHLCHTLVTLWLHCVTLWLHFGYCVVTVWWRWWEPGWWVGGPEPGPMRLWIKVLGGVLDSATNQMLKLLRVVGGGSWAWADPAVYDQDKTRPRANAKTNMTITADIIAMEVVITNLTCEHQCG